MNPHLRIGMYSWRFPSWAGLVHSSQDDIDCFVYVCYCINRLWK